MVDDEERSKAAGSEEYLNEADPSILRFLIASRDVASAQQLRDDLLSMLVAGHETTASVLTWTVYLLCQNPEQMRKVQVLALVFRILRTHARSACWSACCESCSLLVNHMTVFNLILAACTSCCCPTVSCLMALYRATLASCSLACALNSLCFTGGSR